MIDPLKVIDYYEERKIVANLAGHYIYDYVLPFNSNIITESILATPK